MPTLDWIGKQAVIGHHEAVPFRLLQRDATLSAGDAESGNLLVQGDNLEALKALLPQYAGQVKLIYIDPPYNTGNEGWVYNDNVNSPEMKAWLEKVVGREAEDLSRHDKWLCMMYPRLKLLREFLREDGIIAVSIDGNEHRYLELLMDEIFGYVNRLETVIWKKSYGGGSKSKHIVNLHEYIVFFAKRLELIERLELPPSDAILKYYKFSDEKFEQRGPYRLQPLATNSMDERPNLRYAINHEGHEIMPEKQWQWSRERVLAAQLNNDLVIAQKRGDWSVSYKQYLNDEEGEARGQKPYSIIDGIFTQKGTKEVADIFGDGKAFSFPKSTELLTHIIQFTTSSNDLVLDSFAGSGTTGHAVLKQNAADGGNRRFVLVEMLPEVAEPITRKRLEYAVAQHGGGFEYARLGETLFEAGGRIRDGVSYAALAQHVYYSETSETLHAVMDGALLGVSGAGVAVYLLYNGVLKDKHAQGGNVLTRYVLRDLPAHDGPRVIYGTANRLSADTMTRLDLTFKQIPYQIRVR